MVIKNRRLLMMDKERLHGLTLPIDLFFRSLDEDLGPDAIGIILSGIGSDGSRGIREVKRAGGRVFVESPETANFDRHAAKRNGHGCGRCCSSGEGSSTPPE